VNDTGSIPRRHRSKRSRILPFVAWVVLVVGGAALGYVSARRMAINSLAEATAHRIDIYSASLQAELHRYDYLPAMVALSREVADLLQQPDDATQRARTNRYLETIAAQSGAAAVYVMDPQGLTRAASNWNQPASFVDVNFSYRPYFRDAIRGLPGRFYGIGTVSREPGYYFSNGVHGAAGTVGVAAVKVDLDKLDQAWSHDGEKILVVDNSGIVVLSSDSRLKFHALKTLSQETMARLETTRQYEKAGAIGAIGLHATQVLSPAAAIVEIDNLPGETARRGPGSQQYLMQTRPLAGAGWSMLMLSDMQAVGGVARTTALAVACVLASIGLVVLSLRQRHRITQQTAAARAALQKAHDELERKVQLRTEALSDANQQLQSEIVERRRAEETLKATLAELVHTAKLAVLGQMSAGITHELNQPLAALRTLSANTVEFLELGRHDDAVSNLRMIVHLTERMGDITSQLKKFARKSATELHPVAIGPVLADALFLLDQRVRGGHVRLSLSVMPGELQALCDANRLEQVLVNLVANALDAVAEAAVPCVEVRAAEHAGWVVVEVSDNGPGIAPELAPHLFEPFFTTKQQGAGLGLGLAISAGIVREFGGTLRTEEAALGGASFVVRLRTVGAALGDAQPATMMLADG
jgi:two-component system C4-dicarboxylate transport sensor histidine kinase DctB